MQTATAKNVTRMHNFPAMNDQSHFLLHRSNTRRAILYLHRRAEKPASIVSLDCRNPQI